MPQNQIRNIGIFAHVDAGKTTLSEQLLLLGGAIRQSGSVDQGTAHTDNLPVEKRRGISVKSTCVRISWRGVDINLIDTPGHVDFSAEVERSLWALDAAVLVICGAEGVQPQTETLFHALEEQRIPTLLFINKLDREGADADAVLSQCRRLLSADIAPLWDADASLEAICSHDDTLMERYLNGDMPDASEWLPVLSALSRQAIIHPAIKGSALRGEGVSELLDAMTDNLPAPSGASDGELCGVVFAAQQDKTLGRGVWVRLFSGRLENRIALTLPAGIDPVTGEERQVQKKITQIRNVEGHDAGGLGAGGIAVIYGLGDIPIGHIIGSADLLPRKIEPGRLRTPLMTVQVIPGKPEEMNALRAACMTLSGEDPLLKVQYTKALNQLQIHVMGMIQLEILQETLNTRLGSAFPLAGLLSSTGKPSHSRQKDMWRIWLRSPAGPSCALLLSPRRAAAALHSNRRYMYVIFRFTTSIRLSRHCRSHCRRGVWAGR